MEAGTSEKKQTGSDKVTRQKSGQMHITEPKLSSERPAAHGLIKLLCWASAASALKCRDYWNIWLV